MSRNPCKRYYGIIVKGHLTGFVSYTQGTHLLTQGVHNLGLTRHIYVAWRAVKHVRTRRGILLYGRIPECSSRPWINLAGTADDHIICNNQFRIDSPDNKRCILQEAFVLDNDSSNNLPDFGYTLWMNFGSHRSLSEWCHSKIPTLFISILMWIGVDIF